MSLPNYNYPALGSLSAENTRVLGLNQMELARIHTYQMALQKPFLHESPYPRLCGNSHFEDRLWRRTLRLLVLHTSRLSWVVVPKISIPWVYPL